MKTCHNCACDPVCNHTWNGWETCGNWIQKPEKPMTNADRIRAMRDEEQIKFFSMVSKAAGCPPANPMDCMDDCSQCWEIYLGNPAKGTE